LKISKDRNLFVFEEEAVMVSRQRSIIAAAKGTLGVIPDVVQLFVRL
jgi:hypothetical protein